MDFTEKTIQRDIKYSGRIFTVTQDIVELPNGKTSTRDLVFHTGAVAVLVIRDGKMLLVRQYRKPLEMHFLEIPAGKLDSKEEVPLEAAKRELEEETGYTGQLELVYDFYSAIGFCNEKIKLYSASHLKKVENPRPQDEDETLELFEVSLEEAHQLLQNGDICDAKTIMALQYWEQKNLNK